MIPILFEKEDTDFSTNGICRLPDCLSCVVEEERNGTYELEFRYPVTGRNYDQIQEGRVIVCTHDDTRDLQPFDIYRRDIPINGIVKFYAHHISYRLSRIILRPFTAGSCAEAFARMNGNSLNANPFRFVTDKEVAATFTVDAPISVKAILGGMQGSILDIYGKADYLWDRFNVYLYQNRGQDRGVTIRYGKNLANFLENYDISETYNAVVPYWSANDDSGTIVTLPEHILTRTGIDPAEEVVPVPMDLTEAFQNQPTVEQLRASAQARLDNSGAWNPDIHLDIDFVQLWQMPGYEQYKDLQRVALCDTVTVLAPELGVDQVKLKVISVTYDVLQEKYTAMELGEPRISFDKSTVAEAVSQTSGKYASTNYVSNALAAQNTTLRTALTEATEKIVGVRGGYVRFSYDGDGNPYEILIMDDEDVANATNIIRMNEEGIAFSNAGYHPEAFRSAWTIDGQFVANFITSGELDANIIKAGVLTDQTGESWWNLVTGQLHLAMKASDIGAVSESDYAAGVSSLQNYADNAVSTLQNNIQMYFNADSDGVRIGKLVGDQETPYSILITNEKMSFQQHGYEVAYIQYNILHISNVEILDRMTLGDANYGGYFDWIVTDAGIGVKWRGV